MKVQFLNGGLANQAFQYIFAKYYELSHPGEIMYMDDSYFALNTVHNGYELEKVFGIKPHMLSEAFDETLWNYILEQRKLGKSVPQIFSDNGIETHMLAESNTYKNFNPFDGKILHIPANQHFPDIFEFPRNINVYYHGYWVNKNWFTRYQDEFLKIFQFVELVDEKNKQYMEAIQNSKSCSIHIRRGDYVTLKWALEAEQYRKLVEMFIQQYDRNWELFVFSDDIEWCKKNSEELGFRLFSNVHFVEGNTHGKNYIDMQLMSQCKGMIMSNSAFCYLAALLNTRKQCVTNPTDREL